VADSGEDHGETEAIGGGDDLFVPYRPARLDDGGRPDSGNGLESVGEWEVSV